jgi:hypothetical protein
MKTISERDPERTARIIQLFFESTTPQTLPRRIDLLQSCGVCEGPFLEGLKFFMDWPLMLQEDWFMIFLWAPIMACRENTAFELAITMLRKVLAAPAELKPSRNAVYFLFLYQDHIWNLAAHVMGGNPRRQILGFKFFRYLMYAFPQALDWTFDFLESQLPASVVPLTSTRRELSKLITELVREVLADPLRVKDLRRVMSIYQIAFVSTLRDPPFEYRVIEKFAILAIAILGTPTLDHGMADMREVFCMLNRISNWDEANSGVLSRFFTAVLRHSLWHFNYAEMKRFAFETEAQPIAQRVAVLNAIAMAAPGPFSELTRSG